jgi:hypothetical protein
MISSLKSKGRGGRVLLLAGLLGLAVIADAQERADNPKRPLAKNAGRVVQLEEVLRIHDDGSTAIFRSPRAFFLAQDGSLYFADEADSPRLYRYGPEGTLISRFLKRGQGPGEVQHVSGYLVAADRIRVLAWSPPKILDLGLDGRYLGETRAEEDAHGVWFLGQSEGRIYAIRDELFGTSTFRNSGAFTALAVPNAVYELSPDFRAWKKLYEFPVRMMVRRGRGYRLDPIDAVISGTTLYLVHTADYQVTAFDLRAGRIGHVITRAYDRVRTRPPRPGELDVDPETRGVDVPDDPYTWDIDRIQAGAGKLWVFTSTFKSGRNDQQVDLFDEAGRYVDSVILRYPPGKRDHGARWTLMTDDGFFFIPEQEEDGLVTIGKYRIVDPGLFDAQAVPKRTP